MFLDCAKKDIRGKIQLTPHFMIDLDLMKMYVKGYLIQENPTQYMCSSLGTTHTVHYTFNNSKVITTLEYLYHMMTCL